MVEKMILMSILIIAILFATWIKDEDKMVPPFKRRLIIDLTVIASLWLLYGVFIISDTPTTHVISEQFINIGMWYFVAQFVYLIASISPMFSGLIDLLKKNGYKLPEGDDNEEKDDSDSNA